MYRYEVWYEGNCLTEDDGFETEEEANEAGWEAAEDKIQYWKEIDAWRGETLEDMDIRVREI